MVCIDNKNDLAARLSCAPVEVQARLFDALALSRRGGSYPNPEWSAGFALV